MRKKKANRRKEFEEFKKSKSKYHRDFILLKLFNLANDFQDYIDGKNKMREVANLLDGSNKIKMLHSYENKPNGFDIADEDDINLSAL